MQFVLYRNSRHWSGLFPGFAVSGEEFADALSVATCVCVNPLHPKAFSRKMKRVGKSMVGVFKSSLGARTIWKKSVASASSASSFDCVGRYFESVHSCRCKRSLMVSFGCKNPRAVKIPRTLSNMCSIPGNESEQMRVLIEDTGESAPMVWPLVFGGEEYFDLVR